MVRRASRVRREQADRGCPPLAARANSAPAAEAQDPRAPGLRVADRVAQRHRLPRTALHHGLRILHSALRTRPNKNHTVQ